MRKFIVNIHEVELAPRPAAFAATGPAAERYEARMAPLGSVVGARKLGYNITAVPPGKRAFPLHNHRVNEEMFLVLHGRGEVQVGSERYAIREGDLIACPPGGPDTAHQIVNTGSEELRYLAVSTRLTPEIAEYPTTGKFGVLAELEESDGRRQMFRFVGRAGDSADYWEGE